MNAKLAKLINNSKLIFFYWPHSYFLLLRDPHVIYMDEFYEYSNGIPFYFSHSLWGSLENSSFTVVDGLWIN